jgi:peroxiredoxin
MSRRLIADTRWRTARTAAAMVAVLFAAPIVRAQNGSLPLGTPAPGAQVETLDGAPVDLKQYIGRTPVLIEFWATWCEQCEALEPAIRAAAAKYGTQVKFLGVAVSVNQSPARVKRFAEQHKLPLEVLYDRRGNATGAYAVLATSTVVVVDRAGKIVYTGQGGDQNIDAAIQKALK